MNNHIDIKEEIIESDFKIMVNSKLYDDFKKKKLKLKNEPFFDDNINLKIKKNNHNFSNILTRELGSKIKISNNKVNTLKNKDNKINLFNKIENPSENFKNKICVQNSLIKENNTNINNYIDSKLYIILISINKIKNVDEYANLTDNQIKKIFYKNSFHIVSLILKRNPISNSLLGSGEIKIRSNKTDLKHFCYYLDKMGFVYNIDFKKYN